MLTPSDGGQNDPLDLRKRRLLTRLDTLQRAMEPVRRLQPLAAKPAFWVMATSPCPISAHADDQMVHLWARPGR